MSEPLLLADGLGHRWNAGRWLFRDLDLSVPAGRVLSILGPNGRGKTTLMRALTSLQALSHGSIRMTPGCTTAYIPQSARGALAYRVIDMVTMGRAPHLGLLAWPGRHDYAIAEAALERVGVTHLAAQPFKLLSGGERQLVLLARALASDAQLLLLDEPMAALDLKNQNSMLNVLSSLVKERGVSVIVTTHQPQHALALGGDALILGEPGQHILGEARATLTAARLSALYGLRVARVVVQSDGLSPLEEDCGFPIHGVVPLFDTGVNA